MQFQRMEYEYRGQNLFPIGYTKSCGQNNYRWQQAQFFLFRHGKNGLPWIIAPPHVINIKPTTNCNANELVNLYFRNKLI